MGTRDGNHLCSTALEIRERAVPGKRKALLFVLRASEMHHCSRLLIRLFKKLCFLLPSPGGVSCFPCSGPDTAWLAKPRQSVQRKGQTRPKPALSSEMPG